ncbi:MAG: hypothetical protein KA297_14730 [Kofleriaceae bacterium]|nr:hypothetical protein [Kofleriaceae bacterium]
MSAAAMRRRHALVQVRQAELRRAEGPDRAQAVRECVAALGLLSAAGTWPGPRDPVSQRGVEQVRARWARIQRRARAQAIR